jgi:competence protein ComEA
MNPAPPSPPAPVVPPQPSTPVVAAWPRSAQLTTAFLLGVTLTLLAGQGLGYLRWGSRPTELDRPSPVIYRVDLNRAERAELLQLPGVGDNLAARIEAYRREHGGFRTVDELTQVQGVGPATLERLRNWVDVSGDPTRPGPAKVAGTSRKKAAKKADLLTEPIDINRATAEELQRLPRIGPAMAQRILEERQKAPFRSVEELRRVRGIGPKTLEALRPHVLVREEPARTVAVN